MGHQILLVIFGVVFLTANIVSGVRYVGDVVPKQYSDCFNNSQKIYSFELTCNYGGLIHISSLTLSSTWSCGSRPFCRWTRPPYLIRACEGKEYCRYRLGSHYIPCYSFNQIEVTFQCIDDGAGIYSVTCTSQVTPTTSRTVSYHWTTQPFQHYDYGPVVGGIIGGISLICTLCVLTLVWRSRRRNTAMRGERNLRTPPHAAFYNNPAAMTGSVEELPNYRAASYELPPAYSTLPPEILAKGSDGISPPPPYTSGPV